VRHVIVDGAIVVRDRRLTTIDEDEIYDAVQVVMPGFRGTSRPFPNACSVCNPGSTRRISASCRPSWTSTGSTFRSNSQGRRKHLGSV
jgi:hypothetical protein